MSTGDNSNIRLQASGVCKHFSAVRALHDVRITLRAGEVHALMGENGAGKSTLIKVIAGAYSHDAGEITLDGRPVRFATVREAERVGVSCVFQEVNLIPTLSVAENLLLGRFPRRLGFIRWGETKRFARDALAKLGLGHVDVSLPLRSYSIAVRQMIAIARAVNPVDGQAPPRVLILDEPTSSLDTSEVDELFRVMTHLRTQGLAILLVTHFLDQVYRISDRITVLRNGSFVGEWLARELPRARLVEAMIGREQNDNWTAVDAKPRVGRSREPRLVATSLCQRGTLEPIDISIHDGEKLGLAGLLGSGRTETARLIFGAAPASSGAVRVDNHRGPFRSPRRAISAGVAMTPEDRKDDGILPNLSVRDNIAVALQARMGLLRQLNAREQERIADEYIRALNIRTPSQDQPIRLLSGGNQQKVLLARWLATRPRVLILDEPTRGVDVGAKREITRLIEDLCNREHLSVLFISSELDEMVAVCDRVIVLRDRRKVDEIDRTELSAARIMQTIAAPTARPDGRVAIV